MAKCLPFAVVVLALVPWFTTRHWLPVACHALLPLGVKIMEDPRIPDTVLDMFLRPALRVGFVALVQDLEDGYSRDIDLPHQYAQLLTQQPIAIFTPDANEQHYEVETKFFDVALGRRKKYSSGLWNLAAMKMEDAGGPGFEASEDAMLNLYVERAGVQDGMTIMDLGCGWGSVSLYLAEKFPKAKIIGVSNSRTQRKYILDQAKARGFSNLEVETMNVAGDEFNAFLQAKAGQLDRIISIEMFEHMKNYQELLRRLSVALKAEGKLFIHIFCHKYLPYDFKEDDLNSWMTVNFFKGGTMPSQSLLSYFQKDLSLERQWNVNGLHYWLTSEAWLQRMDAKKQELFEVFGGNEEAKLKIRKWRIFFIAIAEFFGFRGGSEFFVTHMLFSKSV